MKLPRNPTNGWLVASVPSPPESPYKGWVPCMDWCVDNIGGAENAVTSRGKNWRYVGEGVFEFRRVNDHTMFLLRWS